MNPDQPDEQASTRFALRELAPLPRVALRVLELLSRPEVEMREVAETVRVDGAFSAEMLRVANSALFALPQEVKTVQHAATLLGHDRLRSLTMTVALRAYLGRNARTAAQRKLWRHCLACALIAEQLAPRRAMDSNLGYAAGLLHDIGRLGLMAVSRAEYSKLFAAAQDPRADIQALERKRFTMDHCEAGLLLAGEWKLPAELALAAARHHGTPEPDEPAIVTLVRLSCQAADLAGFDAVRPYPAPHVGEALKRLADTAMSMCGADVDQLKTTVEEKIRSVELSGSIGS